MTDAPSVGLFIVTNQHTSSTEHTLTLLLHHTTINYLITPWLSWILYYNWLLGGYSIHTHSVAFHQSKSILQSWSSGYEFHSNIKLSVRDGQAERACIQAPYSYRGQPTCKQHIGPSGGPMSPKKELAWGGMWGHGSLLPLFKYREQVKPDTLLFSVSVSPGSFPSSLPFRNLRVSPIIMQLLHF